MSIILVKHSLPEIDAARPARDWVLSDEGQRRCERLADALIAEGVQVVVSSNEPKAIETAHILARRFGLTATTSPGLHEHERRTAPFLDKPAFEATMRRFFAEPDALVFGEETANEAHARFAAAVQRVMAEHVGQTVAIVTHGTVISLLVSRANAPDIDGFALWQRLGLPSFVKLTWPEWPEMKVEQVSGCLRRGRA